MRVVFCLCLLYQLILGQEEPKDAVDIKENDVEDNEIIRPCKIYDIDCIRHFFRAHGQCDIVHGPVPDPVYRQTSTIYIPIVNVTATLLNIKYSGLNGGVVEFYINKKTDRLVLAVEMRNLNINIGTAYIRIQRRAQEPIILTTPVNATIDLLIPTIIIPNLKNLRLDKSEIFTYIDDAAPKASFDKSILVNEDPLVARVGAEALLNYRTVVRQASFLDANFYIITFIQKSICDFGLIPS